MKKIVLSFFALTMLLSVSFAAEKDPFQFGIRMGAQFSSFEGDVIVPNAKRALFLDKKATALIGPAFGFIFEIPVNAYFEIRPELNFGSQGQRFQKGDFTYSQWLGAVQVPILLKGQYGSDKIRGFIHVGPQFGANVFLLDRLKGNDDKKKDSYNMKDAKLKTFDAGLAVGVGVEFPAAKGIEIEARYYLGMADINDNKLIKETKNRSLHATVAFKF